MIGCYFKASGANFDVDRFLEVSPLDSDVDSVHYVGQPMRLPNQTCDTSGFAITLNDVFGQMDVQIPDAIRFLQDQEAELRRLMHFPGVTDLRLVFTYCPGNVAMRDEYFPPELLRLTGALSIAIALSVYPGEFDPADYQSKSDDSKT